jgi:hypothetical protein
VPIVAVQSEPTSHTQFAPASIISSRPQGPRAPPEGL